MPVNSKDFFLTELSLLLVHKMFIFQGIKMKNLENKINEFSRENNEIQSTLEDLKRAFLTDISEITDYLR